MKSLSSNPLWRSVLRDGEIEDNPSDEDIAWRHKFLGISEKSLYPATPVIPENTGVVVTAEDFSSSVKKPLPWEAGYTDYSTVDVMGGCGSVEVAADGITSDLSVAASRLGDIGHAFGFMGGVPVGVGLPFDNCGDISFVGVCEHEAPGDKVGSHKRGIESYHCDSWICPECYGFAINRAVKVVGSRFDSVVGALNAALGVGVGWSAWAKKHKLDQVRRLSARHFVFSFNPKERWTVEELRSYFVKSVIPRFGVAAGGVAVVHLFRLDDDAKHDFWRAKRSGSADGLKIWDWVKLQGARYEFEHSVYGPHIHFIGVGRWEKSDVVYEKTRGRVSYKNKGHLRSDRDFKACLAYALGHAAVPFKDGRAGGQAYVWCGILNNSITKLEKVRVEEVVKCGCGGRLEKHSCRVFVEGAVPGATAELDWNELCYSRDSLDIHVGVEDSRRFLTKVSTEYIWHLRVSVRGPGEDNYALELKRDLERVRDIVKRSVV